MTDIMPLLLFLSLFIFLMLGFPVAFTLGGLSLIFGFATFGLNLFNLLPLRIWGVMSNYVLLAVPLFVFMGVMLEKSGIAEQLLETMALLFGKLSGGLAISVILVGTMLAASTGIVGATVVTMGLLSLPTMLKRGYNPELASGTIAASGTLGQIIPPSIVLVLLGSVLNVPVGDLFMAAVAPGFLLVALYLIWIVIIAKVRPSFAPPMPENELADFHGWIMIRRVLMAFFLPFFLILAVLGTIFAGIASPTEAAAVGAFGATLLTILKRKFNMQTLKSVMIETTHLTTMVFIILVGATAFGLVFRGMEGDRILTGFILNSELGPYAFLSLVMLIIFVAGFFIDFIEITFIIVPVVAPIFVNLNMNLIWVGILIALNLQTSFLTPPFGFSLFYLKGVAPPSVTTNHIYRGVIPFIIIQLIALALVIFFPKTAMWLPQVLAQ